MASYSPLTWLTLLFISTLAYSLQLVRWLRIAQREGYRGSRIAYFYRKWAFPASVSATAVAHQGSLTNRFLASPFRLAQNAFETSRRPGSDVAARSEHRLTAKPTSLTLIAAIFTMLSAATNVTPFVFIISMTYGLIFPWGLRLRGRQLPLRWDRGAFTVAGIATTVSALVGLSALVLSPLVAMSLIVWLVPVCVAVAGATQRHAAERLVEHGPIVISYLGPRVTVVTDNRPEVDVNLASVLEVFNGLGLTGRTYVATAGLVDRGPDQDRLNFRLGSAIRESGHRLIAIARINAEALLEGYGDKQQRVDSREEAERWLTRYLGPDDGVLFMGDIPDYYP